MACRLVEIFPVADRIPVVEAARVINMVVPYAVVAAVAAVLCGVVLALFLTDDTLLVCVVVLAFAAVCALVMREAGR